MDFCLLLLLAGSLGQAPGRARVLAALLLACWNVAGLLWQWLELLNRGPRF